MFVTTHSKCLKYLHTWSLPGVLSFIKHRPPLSRRRRRARMPADHQGQRAARRQVNRREFLKRAGEGSLWITGFLVGAGSSRGFAHPPSPYPSWVPPSDNSPKRGGILTRASAWDPPVLDPRLTNSVGLFQIATLTYNRLLRYPFADEGKNNSDLALTGDLAEAWEGSPD